MKKKIIIISLILITCTILFNIQKEAKKDNYKSISIVLETSKGNINTDNFPKKEEYEYDKITCKNLNSETTATPTFNTDSWKLDLNIKSDNQIDGQFECTIYFKEKVTSENCFAFDSSTGTITDYYDYEGGGTSGIACPRDVVIPSTIGGISVTKIGDGSSMSQLNSTDSSDNVTLIDNATFSSNQLIQVGIILPPDPIIDPIIDPIMDPTMPFKEKNLNSVVIPDSVTTIGTGAFSQNQLTSVTIPEGVTTIGAGAFAFNQLTTVTIPDSVITIGREVFLNNQLTSATIGKNVTAIGDWAFNISEQANPNLTRIVNKTGRSFDWGLITSGTNGNNFVTGSFKTETGKTLTVTSS